MRQKKNKKKTECTKQLVVRRDIDLKLQLITLVGGKEGSIFSDVNKWHFKALFLCLNSDLSLGLMLIQRKKSEVIIWGQPPLFRKIKKRFVGKKSELEQHKNKYHKVIAFHFTFSFSITWLVFIFTLLCQLVRNYIFVSTRTKKTQEYYEDPLENYEENIVL